MKEHSLPEHTLFTVTHQFKTWDLHAEWLQYVSGSKCRSRKVPSDTLIITKINSLAPNDLEGVYLKSHFSFQGACFSSIMNKKKGWHKLETKRSERKRVFNLMRDTYMFCLWPRKAALLYWNWAHISYWTLRRMFDLWWWLICSLTAVKCLLYISLTP